MLKVSRSLRVFGVVLFFAGLAALGCGSGNHAQNAAFRLMNASPGETSLTVTINSTAFTSAVTDGTVSNYNFVTWGTSTLNIVGPNLISGGTSTLFDGSVMLSESTSYTAIADNYPQNFGVTLYVDDNTPPAAGNFNLRIINSAPGLGKVDAYVVTPGASLTAVSPKVPALAFQGASSYLPLPAGTYEVIFTLVGQKTPYINSGPVAFAAGQVRSFVGLNGETGGYTDSVLMDLN
jgi:hypothetical protein